MFINGLLEKIDTFVALAKNEIPEDERLTEGNPNSPEMKNRQQKMKELWIYYHGLPLHDMLRKGLLRIINELGGDIFTLKETGFAPDLLKMMSKLHQELISIVSSLTEHNPYQIADKLIKYVFDKPNKSIIDNLNFLAENHLSKSHPQGTKVNRTLGKAKFFSLYRLKKLTQDVEQYVITTPEEATSLF